MKEIAVRKSGVVIVDDEDYEYLNQFRWYSDSFGYVFRTKGKEDNFRRVKMHREIMNPPDDMVIDHINHNIRDNRRSNLRIVTRSENSQNHIRKYLAEHPEEAERIKNKKPAVLDYKRMVRDYNNKHKGEQRISMQSIARDMVKEGVFKSVPCAMHHIITNNNGTAKRIFFRVLIFLQNRLQISLDEMRSEIDIKEGNYKSTL